MFEQQLQFIALFSYTRGTDVKACIKGERCKFGVVLYIEHNIVPNELQ